MAVPAHSISVVSEPGITNTRHLVPNDLSFNPKCSADSRHLDHPSNQEKGVMETTKIGVTNLWLRTLHVVLLSLVTLTKF
jgi:hypothetical protein